MVAAEKRIIMVTNGWEKLCKKESKLYSRCKKGNKSVSLLVYRFFVAVAVAVVCERESLFNES